MRDEGGQAIVLVAAAFLTLTLVVAVTVNTAQLFVVRRSAQTAADAAALAGARAISLGDTTDTARLIAAYAAKVNGFEDGANGDVVKVNTPPMSGSYSGDTKFVEVLITRNVGATLAPQLGITKVSARGVAGRQGRLGRAIYTLDSGDTPDAFKVGPNANILMLDPNGSGGQAQVNSSNPGAASIPNTFSGTIGPGDASLSVVGCITHPDQWRKWIATPSCNALPGADPYEGAFTPPTPGGVVTPTCVGSNCAATAGTYTTAWANNKDYVLGPGIYIFKGVDLRLSGQSSITDNGAGVLLFFTGPTYPSTSPGQCGNLELVGNGSQSLSPILSDPFLAFVVIFFDPNCTGGTLTLGGNGISTSGLMYAPRAQAIFKGAQSSAVVTAGQLVVKTLDLQNGSLTVDQGSGAGLPPGIVRLSE